MATYFWLDRLSFFWASGGEQGPTGIARKRTVEATPGAAGVEPAVGAAAAHLAVDDDAARPGPWPLWQFLQAEGQLAGDVGEEGLDVAAALQVELLLGPALLGKAQARLARQPLGQRALDVELAVARVAREPPLSCARTTGPAPTTRGGRRRAGAARPAPPPCMEAAGCCCCIWWCCCCWWSADGAGVNWPPEMSGAAVGQDVGGGVEVHAVRVVVLLLLLLVVVVVARGGGADPGRRRPSRRRPRRR